MAVRATRGQRPLATYNRTKTTAPTRASETTFNEETLEKLADDLKEGRIPLPRVTITDPEQVGLRAIIRDTGLISFHVNYHVNGARPYLKLGDHPEMKISEARSLARTIITLAQLGIDPQEGLHDRLIREIKRDGVKWRPT